MVDNSKNNAPPPPGGDEPPMQPGKQIKVKVQEARKRDLGRSIIRLDTEAMEEMNVKTGDIIEIHGKEKSTAAIAWPSYPQDQGLGIARMDARVQKNVNVGLDDMVMINKVEERPAKSIVLSPVSLKIKPNSRFEGFVKRKVLNNPLAKDDLVYVNIGMTKETVFRVTSIKPGPIATVKPASQLTISEMAKEETPSGIPYVTYEDLGGLDQVNKCIRWMPRR